MWYKNYKKLKKLYKSDTKDLNSTDFGDTLRINEYRFIGKLKMILLFIPFAYTYMRFKHQYNYFYAFNLVIDTLSRNHKFTKIFEIYSIICTNRYGYFIFESKHAIPEEFKEKHINPDVYKDLVVQHFQDTAIKLFSDIGEHEVSDVLNLDSISNNKLELFLEPDGYYELIALKELRGLKNIIMLIYILISILITLFVVF